CVSLARPGRTRLRSKDRFEYKVINRRHTHLHSAHNHSCDIYGIPGRHEGRNNQASPERQILQPC
ncbi:MAG: hypothetical protein MKZ70_10880, partial [Opitutales bacterium]|nr:hypothetical protein [Opitutales bacterium]